MSSDSGLDDPNDQLEDTELTQNAPTGSDDGIDKEEMDDLFGDDEVDEAAEAKARRQLDDEDLDSGDDMDRSDRIQREANEAEPEMVTDDYNVIDVDFPRHPIPEPSDGENYLLKVPQFVSIEPAAFDIQSFQPPTTDHHSTTSASTGFSAHKTAQTTVRWRHSPSNPSELQSNARFLRWSDGSLTLQLASDPTVQYEIAPKALAPRQRNAPKPTAVSINDGKRGAEKWSEKSESWTYLASASNASFMIRVTNKITASLQVMPSNDGAADEALERLQISMAASRAREGHIKKMDGVAEDPELAKKKAEQAEREKTRAIRRLEAQVIREKERASRGFGGARGGRSGLTVGGLEDDDTGGRGAARAPRAKQRRRPKNDEYSDDEEEYYGRRRGREDDYDEEDDFIAASDEEEDRDAEGSEEDLDAIIESRTKEQDKAARAGTPKRDRPQDADADVEHDSPVSRQKRRRVVSDDDDE